jgi:hypothetical protein
MQQMLQQITLGGAMIALPIFLQIKLEYDALQAGLSHAPLSLTMFAIAMLAGRKARNRLAMAGGILLATLALSFTNMTEASKVIPQAQQQQIADGLEDDAQVVSNTQIEELAGEPQAVQDEIVQINTDANDLSLQVALLVPILAGVLGLLNAFRMLRLPDIEPVAKTEVAALA